jgi:hypothetical protein
MNWYSIILAAISGGLAVLIATLIFGKEPADKSAHKIVIVVLFIAFTALSKIFLLPKINAYSAKAEATIALKSVPAFRSIEKYAPDTYRKIFKILTDSIENGGSQEQAITLVRAQVQTFVLTRLPHASDDALISYVRIMDIEMAELQAKGSTLCYQFLHPQVVGGIDTVKLISRETQGKDLAALNEIIKSSNSKRPIASEDEVMPNLQPVFLALREKYGDGVAVIENPTAPGVDKARVCSVTRELYQKIVALPPDQAGKTLRWMFAQQ